MGLLKLKTKLNVEDYLEGEKVSPVKHEYVDGEVFAVAGATVQHNIIAGGLYAKLLNKLADSDCQPFISEVKVRTSDKTFYYPDVMVCREDFKPNSLVCENPILIIEVASPSTEKTDRREKSLFYRQMPSMQEYAIVEQNRMAVEIHRRQPDGRWITYYFNESDDIVEFASVGLSLPLTEIYRRVKFDSNAGTIEY